MAEPITVIACDVGNTRTALGRVAGEEVSDVRRVAGSDAARNVPPGALTAALSQLWQAAPAPKAIVACSVNPAGLAILESSAQGIHEKVLVVGRELPLPIETDLPQPERIGTDRLCAAAMAYKRLGQACVVADFGTAITIDCVNDDGVFLGGAILPGLKTGSAALARGTAALPEVEPVRPDWAFGKDTRQAIVGGLVFGARGALRELTETYATALGHWPLLILTGGDAELVGGGNDMVQAIVPELTLMGVALAYQISKPPKP